MNRGLKYLKFNSNLFKLKKHNLSSTVSYVQRPGDSQQRVVTLIPGEGIGRDLTSKIKI
jgi:hypothetical protein